MPFASISLKPFGNANVNAEQWLKCWEAIWQIIPCGIADARAEENDRGKISPDRGLADWLRFDTSSMINGISHAGHFDVTAGQKRSCMWIRWNGAVCRVAAACEKNERGIWTKKISPVSVLDVLLLLDRPSIETHLGQRYGNANVTVATRHFTH